GFSFGAWMRPDAFSGAMGWWYDAGWGSTFIAAGGATVHFRVGTGNPATDHSVPGSVPVGGGAHGFLTPSGDNDSLYINGHPPGNWPSLPMAGNVSTLLIGASYAGNFNGALDDVTVYSRELAPDEVALLYNGALVALPSAPARLGSPFVAGGNFSF